MKGKFWKLVAAIGLVGILLFAFAGVALAEEPAGTGPDDALVPKVKASVVEPGQEIWYAFNYDGGEGQINVLMDVNPDDGANFTVRTPYQVELWRKNGTEESVGGGSPNEHLCCDLFWTGSFNTPGTYYVVVEHTGVREGAVNYAIKVTGDGVSLPTVATPAETTPLVIAGTPAQDMAELEEVAKGYDPDTAMAPQGSAEYIELKDGERHWYAFQYDGEEGQIKVNLDADPDGAVRFMVRTPEDVDYWQRTGEDAACGCGTANDNEAGDLFWTGSFNTPGTYYVIVEQTEGSDGGYYSLNVEGSGVWF